MFYGGNSASQLLDYPMYNYNSKFFNYDLVLI